MTKADRVRVERNRRWNESLVQSRPDARTRTALYREAKRRKVSVSALVAQILAVHFGLASD